MPRHEQKDFFLSIRRSISISYFIASIIPLGLLVYFALKYVYPVLLKGTSSNLPLHIGALLVLAVVVSILGLTLSIRTTTASILSLQDLHKKLNSLFDITKQFRETPYLDILLENIVNSAIKLNSAEAGSLLLYNEIGELVFKVAVGEKSMLMKDKAVNPGEGVSGWVAEKGKSAVINDVKNDKRYSRDFDNETGFETRSIMSVPIIYKKKTIGVIEVLNRKQGIFTDEDEKLLFSLADQAAISISQSKAHESQQSDIIQITSILVEAQDRFSTIKKGHGRRVSNYANLIGKHLGLNEESLKNLYYASLLHDIGFMRIHIQIPPSQADIEHIRKHSQIGYDIIKPLSLWGDAAELILYHHERFDGNGYPHKKKGLDIPLGSRVIFVADTFDVLTSKTSYKDNLDFKGAIQEIERNAGTQFDPEIVKAFKESMKEADLLTD
jgi:putative methionine-R-sulfoxide reductase with GAF domain